MNIEQATFGANSPLSRSQIIRLLALSLVVEHMTGNGTSVTEHVRLARFYASYIENG